MTKLIGCLQKDIQNKTPDNRSCSTRFYRVYARLTATISMPAFSVATTIDVSSLRDKLKLDTV